MDIRDASDLIFTKLEDWATTIIAMLPNFVLAVIVVFIGAIIAKVARNLIYKALRKVTRHESLLSLITTTIHVAIILVACFIALGVLDLTRTVTTLLAGAGIIGLALGFAFQDIMANFMSGVIMAIRRPFEEGDLIETQGSKGIVQRLNLRSTIIRSLQGQIHIVPNKEVFENTIINYNTHGKRRIDLECGVSYGDDLQKVKEVTLKAVKSVNNVLSNEDISLYFTEFGDSSINYVVRFWVKFKKQPDFLQARSEAIMAIKQQYDENDIMIPFPIRTLDFGIKGGEKLHEVWPKENHNNSEN
ncbi:mechanosensitive ion channel family protein [Litoribacter ruber]|uniref:mechanosensitive ion channel family protein n=1 Tax=Litoribacter ruber TaxID=702568 RepID=UPI001BDAC14A|nr:mechanosensitive ion channel family protein [Litoribacter ruber]MBT0812497.1 mechanosensitive ion channel family protein [Litoribacter ruber]